MNADSQLLAKAYELIQINALKQLLTSHKKIRSLFFSAAEPNRRSLYARMANILAKQIGFEVRTSKTGECFFLSR